MTLAGDQRVGLIGVDGSSDSVTLVDFVRESFHPSWRWFVVHVVDLAAPAHPEAAGPLEMDAATRVEEIGRRLPGSTAIVEQSADVANGLRIVARDHNASAIVIGPDDSDHGFVFTGSRNCWNGWGGERSVPSGRSR